MPFWSRPSLPSPCPAVHARPACLAARRRGPGKQASTEGGRVPCLALASVIPSKKEKKAVVQTQTTSWSRQASKQQALRVCPKPASVAASPTPHKTVPTRTPSLALPQSQQRGLSRLAFWARPLLRRLCFKPLPLLSFPCVSPAPPSQERTNAQRDNERKHDEQKTKLP